MTCTHLLQKVHLLACRIVAIPLHCRQNPVGGAQARLSRHKHAAAVQLSAQTTSVLAPINSSTYL